MTAQFRAAGLAIDSARFDALRASARQDQNAAFSEVAKEFEALFIQMMLKAARDASPESGLFNSNELKLYREMLDSQMAMKMAETRSLGFEDLLRRDMLLPGTNVDAENISREPLQVPQRSNLLPLTRTTNPFNLDDLLSASDRPAHFVQKVASEAKFAAERLGVTPDILIAQAALETGWGEFMALRDDGSSSNNLFGIKADANWRGAIATARTLEYLNNRPVHVNASFRAYESIADAFEDYVDFLHNNPRYGAALTQPADGKGFIKALSQAGYATDPDYAAKVSAVAERVAKFTQAMN